jgi:4-hydroxybenzoate polyprenyltransferase
MARLTSHQPPLVLSGAAAVCDPSLPLAVDLDGTLVRTDTLHEALLGAVRHAPSALPTLAVALRSGKAAFKRRVEAHAPTFDPTLLPYNEDVLAYLRAEHARGRRIGLFTASDQAVADAVAAHIGLFEVAVGSDGQTNLSGERKLDAIRRHFGQAFVYAGDNRVDLPIFAASSRVILVGPVQMLRASLPAGKQIEASFPATRGSLRAWAQALRPRHWAKNSLVFVPSVFAAHHLDALVALQILLLFFALSILASATYLVNDLFDLQADRQHPRKRFRPFAAGRLQARDGLAGAGAMILLALLIGLMLPWAALSVLVAYLVMTLAYSFWLKRLAMVDVVVLAGLFTLRVLGGSTVLPTPVSPWLLSLSMLFFLGLAMIKRYAELDRTVRGGATALRARGYSAGDLPLLLAAGMASGMASTVLLAIYLIKEQYPREVYGNPVVLWGMFPILVLFLLRNWHLTVHGRMDEDPVVFALRDPVSLILGACMLGILAASW